VALNAITLTPYTLNLKHMKNHVNIDQSLNLKKKTTVSVLVTN